MIRNMVMVYSNGKVVTDILVSMTMMKDKDKVKCSGLMEVATEVSGVEESNMELE